MRKIIGTACVRAAYLVFLLLVGFAAAAYGLTRESTIGIFNLSLGGCIALWLLGCALERRRPATGGIPWLLCLCVLLLGWSKAGLGTLNESLLYNPDIPEDFWLHWEWLLNYGSRVPSLSIPAMCRTTALLGGMLLSIELWKTPGWRRALLLTLLATALGMTAFFFLQKSFGAPFLLPSETGRGTLSFATYRYWGNAASYLNLFWPPAAAAAVYALLYRSSLGAIWLIPCLLLLAATFMNQSKAGNALAAAGIPVFILLAAMPIRGILHKRRMRIKWSHALAASLPIAVLALSLFFALPWKRWEYLANTVEKTGSDTRLRAYALFMHMLPDAGWSGFGPGTFQREYLSYVKEDEQILHTPFWAAHQDYIQTVVEWGYLGTVLWGALIVIPAFAIARQLRNEPESPDRFMPVFYSPLLDTPLKFLLTSPPPEAPILAAGVMTSMLLTGLHAAMDFPMQIASLQFYFLIWLGLGWSQHRQHILKRNAQSLKHRSQADRSP